MERDLLEYTINRLAESLQEHASLLRDASRYAYLAKTLPQDPSVASRVAEILESLRGLRERLLEDAQSLLDSLGLAGEEEMDDINALAGYYLVAGYREEIEFLSLVSKVVDVSRDLEKAEELASVFSRLAGSFKSQH